MPKVGVDSLAIYSSHYTLHLSDLAKARGIEANKYHVGLGQYVMAVPPPGEDIVTMAANAAQMALRNIDINQIENVFFATESGIDQSKSAGLFLHGLLNLPRHCRVVEIKQACYSATAAIQFSLPYLRENPDKKVLVVASDIARYGLHTSGESSQGAGATAIVLSANPRIMEIEREYGIVSEDIMDFWRPNYSSEAFVEGKYSSKMYLNMLQECWEQYTKISGRKYQDHDYYCYHVPVPRLIEKAHQHLLKFTGNDQVSEEIKNTQIQSALQYGRQIGNSYSASLYLALASLLDHEANLEGKRLGFYSYGSGCVAEFFSGVIQPNYQKQLNTIYHQQMLAHRQRLSYDEYVKFYEFQYAQDGIDQIIPHYNTGYFRLSQIEKHKRIYSKVLPNVQSLSLSTVTQVINEGCRTG